MNDVRVALGIVLALGVAIAIVALALGAAFGLVALAVSSGWLGAAVLGAAYAYLRRRDRKGS